MDRVKEITTRYVEGLLTAEEAMTQIVYAVADESIELEGGK